MLVGAASPQTHDLQKKQNKLHFPLPRSARSKAPVTESLMMVSGKMSDSQQARCLKPQLSFSPTEQEAVNKRIFFP